MARGKLFMFGVLAIMIIGAMVISLVVIVLNKSSGQSLSSSFASDMDKRSGAVASDATLCNCIGKCCR